MRVVGGSLFNDLAGCAAVTFDLGLTVLTEPQMHGDGGGMGWDVKNEWCNSFTPESSVPWCLRENQYSASKSA
jgi:hypothetical protein